MTSPHQLLLELRPETPPRLDNFVAGANAELLARLETLTGQDESGALYLWGPIGCGKSHLLTAAAAAAATQRPVVCLAADLVGTELALDAGALLVIDDVAKLAPDAQVTLFRAFNDTRRLGLQLLLAGDQPPLRLALREDLRTRIGQALIYEVQPLTDDEKSAALQRHALDRGMIIDAAVLNYLLRHGRRDLPSLIAMLNALDHASLEYKRPPTLPLLRELMQTALETGA